VGLKFILNSFQIPSPSRSSLKHLSLIYFLLIQSFFCAMRFSNSFLAAGLTAIAYSAPIYDEESIGECDYEPETSSSALAVIGTFTRLVL
jgi:hypothetical protein